MSLKIIYSIFGLSIHREHVNNVKYTFWSFAFSGLKLIGPNFIIFFFFPPQKTMPLFFIVTPQGKTLPECKLKRDICIRVNMNYVTCDLFCLTFLVL